MTHYAGVTEEEETENQEAMDFSHFELLRTVKEAGIKVICLDECHHLKNEWWKALEDFMKEMGEGYGNFPDCNTSLYLPTSYGNQ